jgi:ABC-type methionine transport system permease subunit
VLLFSTSIHSCFFLIVGSVLWLEKVLSAQFYDITQHARVHVITFSVVVAVSSPFAIIIIALAPC